MRKIKFRAWLTLSDYDNDGNDKDYYGMATKISVHYDGSIGFSVEDGRHIFDGDIFERALDNGNIDEYEDWVLWEGPCELMQYTGLKDKNGVDIYEGDIINFDSNGYGEGKLGIVTWDDELSGFSPFCEQILSAADSYSEWSISSVVVVGNKYEDKELLR